MSAKYKDLNLGELIESSKHDPVGVFRAARQLYEDAISENSTDIDIKNRMLNLYWISRTIHDVTVNKNFSGTSALIEHKPRQYDMGREPHVLLSKVKDFEKIDQYMTRLTGLFEKENSYGVGEFWKEKQNSVLRFIFPDEIDNFKRTYGHVLSNFFPSSFDGHVRDLMEFIMNVNDCTISSDEFEPYEEAHFERINARISSFSIRGRFETQHNFYAFYTSILWRKAVFLDDCKVMCGVQESVIGNPYRIRRRGELISQDIARSSTEYNIIKTTIGKKANNIVLEIGAGYGRLCEIFIQRGTKKYIIVDIFPSIYLAEQYMKARFPNLQIFPAQDFEKFDEVQNQIDAASIVFLHPCQIALLPDGYTDLVININSFMEMSVPEVNSYFKEIDRLSAGYLYIKQWIENKSKSGVHQFNRNNYPVSKSWLKCLDRIDPLHSDFFEQIWRIE
ncbi:putative sugar O-methyltransferase [Thalassobaculum salexigens]|uniref:putative sugar O-methyltransferase n=1 Tax=Thalassobaculum salexigens TaxID=455360 RepID=UPI000A049B79|nr:putative sugar O-methyltransferase [Thalassobaculum salexigens]